MKAVFIASAAALLSGVYAQDFSINTPASLTQCQPVLIQWQGGQAPYFLSVYNSGAPTVTAENLGQQNGTSFTWTVDIAAGQSVGFNLVDSTGAQKQSAAVPIQSGSSSSCVGQSSSSASAGSGSSTTAGSSGSGSTSAASGSSTPTPTTPASGSTAGSGSSSSKAGSSSTSAASSSSTSSSSNNSAVSQAAQFGVAGVIGAAIVAILA